MTNKDKAILVARFAGDLPQPMSHGERREMVAKGLAYGAPSSCGTDYILTPEGRRILKAWRSVEKAKEPKAFDDK